MAWSPSAYCRRIVVRFKKCHCSTCDKEVEAPLRADHKHYYCPDCGNSLKVGPANLALLCAPPWLKAMLLR